MTWLVIKKTIFLPFPIHSFIFHPNYTPPSWSSFPWPLASPLSSTSEKGKVPNTWYPPTLASQVTVGLNTSLRPEKTVQLGERDPQTGNRVRVSHHSSCWKTHVKTKLHICYLCVKDLDTAAHVWSSVSDLVSMTLQGFRFFDSVSIPVESLSLPLVSSFLPLILSRPPELHLTLGYESLHLFWLAAVLSFSESVLLGSCLWIHDDRYKHSLRLQSSWRRKAGQQYFPNDSLRTNGYIPTPKLGGLATAFIYVPLTQDTCVSKPEVINITINKGLTSCIIVTRLWLTMMHQTLTVYLLESTTCAGMIILVSFIHT